MLPPSQMPGEWEQECWDEWASHWPWHPTARERAERARHAERRASRHYHSLWDSVYKRAMHHAVKTRNNGRPWLHCFLQTEQNALNFNLEYIYPHLTKE